jgi:ecdysone 20-monooxygenase
MFSRYGDIIREEALWNIPVLSVKERDFIERVLRHSGKYPIRPPNEVTANYRNSRPDRYTNTGLVNE